MGGLLHPCSSSWWMTGTAAYFQYSNSSCLQNIIYPLWGGIFFLKRGVYGDWNMPSQIRKYCFRNLTILPQKSSTHHQSRAMTQQPKNAAEHIGGINFQQQPLVLTVSLLFFATAWSTRYMILQGGPLNRTNQISKQITVDLINISKILYKSATLFKTVKHIGQNNSPFTTVPF